MAVCVVALAAQAVPSVAQPPGPRWSVMEANPAAGPLAALRAQGWQCNESLGVPTAGVVLALCRSTRASADGELRLLAASAAAGGKQAPREIGRLADATQAHMRIFTPPQACDAGAAGGCLAALVLIDQRDESSCYGTQVLVSRPGAALLDLKFIDEVRQTPDGEQCVGSDAAVSGGPREVQIHLAAPLARIGKDGNTRALKAGSAVTYRIRPDKPALQRDPDAP